ncbi:MAG: hypothetical protein GY757_33810, partial [bacterium]|nr:hypothetical protein [bacterium]
MHKKNFFHVDYSLTSTLAETEPEDYTTEYNGDIMVSGKDETAGKSDLFNPAYCKSHRTPISNYGRIR